MLVRMRTCGVGEFDAGECHPGECDAGVCLCRRECDVGECGLPVTLCRDCTYRARELLLLQNCKPQYRSFCKQCPHIRTKCQPFLPTRVGLDVRVCAQYTVFSQVCRHEIGAMICKYQECLLVLASLLPSRTTKPYRSHPIKNDCLLLSFSSKSI